MLFLVDAVVKILYYVAKVFRTGNFLNLGFSISLEKLEDAALGVH